MIEVRSATVDDLPRVVELWDRAGGPTRHPGRFVEANRLLERDPDALIVAADADGSLAGTLIVGWDGWRCHLYRLAVESAFRRSGVAGRLVDEARRRAEAHGAPRMDASVADGNVPAEKFWANAGFAFDTADRRWSASLTT